MKLVSVMLLASLCAVAQIVSQPSGGGGGSVAGLSANADGSISATVGFDTNTCTVATFVAAGTTTLNYAAANCVQVTFDNLAGTTTYALSNTHGAGPIALIQITGTSRPASAVTFPAAIDSTTASQPLFISGGEKTIQWFDFIGTQWVGRPASMQGVAPTFSAGVVRAAPAAVPPVNSIYCWNDLTDLIPKCEDSAGNVTMMLRPDTTTITRAGGVLQAQTANATGLATNGAVAGGAGMSCLPASLSGVAYVCNTGTGGPSPALAGYSATQHPILFRPDVSSGANPTVNISGLGAIALQKNNAGTLAAITTNDLTAGVDYVLLPIGNPVTAFEVVPSNFSTSFTALTSGTNTTAAMLVGTGASLGPTGTGTVKATSVVDGAQLPVLTAVATASAVDNWSMTNGATANPATVSLQPAGTDANIHALVTAKGTGATKIHNPGGAADSTCVIELGSDKYTRYPCFDNQGDFWASGSITLGNNWGAPFSSNTITLSGSPGVISVYKAIGTAGEGVAPIYAAPAYATGQIASILATNLQCGGVICAAGHYCVVISLDTTNAQAGTGNVTPAVLFTNGAARTISGTLMNLTAGNASTQQLCFHTDGTANIQYQVTYVSTGQFDVEVALTELR